MSVLHSNNICDAKVTLLKNYLLKNCSKYSGNMVAIHSCFCIIIYMLRILDKSIPIKKCTVWLTSYCGGIIHIAHLLLHNAFSTSSSTITMDTSDATHVHNMINQLLKVTVYRKYHLLSRQHCTRACGTLAIRALMTRDISLYTVNYHMTKTLDKSIPIENVHCLAHFLLYSDIFHIPQCYHTSPQGI